MTAVQNTAQNKSSDNLMLSIAERDVGIKQQVSYDNLSKKIK